MRSGKTHAARVLIALGVISFSTPQIVHTAEPKSKMTTGSIKIPDDVRAFCTNIADAAREQRYALQRKELNKLKSEINDKMKELESTREAVKEWVRKRDSFAEMARESVVEIYSKMRPDAAAGRMEQLEGALAAAILLKLKPRTAGVILNEMSAEKAAMLTGIMAAASDVDQRT